MLLVFWVCVKVKGEMGRLFLINLEGNLYSCKHCNTHFAISDDIISKHERHLDRCNRCCCPPSPLCSGRWWDKQLGFRLCTLWYGCCSSLDSKTLHSYTT